MYDSVIKRMNTDMFQTSEISLIENTLIFVSVGQFHLILFPIHFFFPITVKFYRRHKSVMVEQTEGIVTFILYDCTQF